MTAAAIKQNVELAAAATVEQWPLKGLLPPGINYETARRHAEAGTLVAQKIGGRWFCTKAAMATWIASTGRLR